MLTLTEPLDERAVRLECELARLRRALALIADGSTPPDAHGHYLAHRQAVQIARNALRPQQ